MSHRNLISHLTVLLLMFCCFQANLAYSQDKTKKKPKKNVIIETLSPETIEESIHLPGEVIAIQKAMLSSTLEGPIGFCPLREGDEVNEGDALVKIARQLFTAEVEVAQASLKVAKAKLNDLRAGYRPQEINKARELVKERQKSFEYIVNDVKRIENLVNNGALASDELEKVQVKLAGEAAKLQSAKDNLEILESGMTHTAIAVQQAMVDEAEAKLKLSQAKLAECRINAPFPGVVTSVLVQKGDLATAKMSLIEVTNLSSQIIRVAVPEVLATKVEKGMTAEFTLDAVPNRKFSGRVERIFPSFEKDIRTRLVEIAPDSTQQLYPGMFARVRLILKLHQDVIAFASELVQFDKDKKPYVYVVTDGKKAKKIFIELGPEVDGRYIISNGLNSGHKLVVAGFEKLKDNVEVKVSQKQPKNSKS